MGDSVFFSCWVCVVGALFILAFVYGVFFLAIASASSRCSSRLMGCLSGLGSLFESGQEQACPPLFFGCSAESGSASRRKVLSLFLVKCLPCPLGVFSHALQSATALSTSRG